MFDTVTSAGCESVPPDIEGITAFIGIVIGNGNGLHSGLPTADGLKVTAKDVELEDATDAAGDAVIEKSELFSPLMDTPLTVRAEDPLFCMVNVRAVVPDEILAEPNLGMVGQMSVCHLRYRYWWRCRSH